MEQAPPTQRPYLPTEIQLQVISHLARDFRQNLLQPASCQPWRSLHGYILVNRAWFEEFVVALARSPRITDVISHALSPSLIDAVLQNHLHKHESGEVVIKSEPDLRAYAFACTRRNLSASLERVLAALTQRMLDRDQKWLILIALRNRHFACAELLVPRHVLPHNFPIWSIIRAKQIDVLKWMIDHGAPVKGSTWSLLAYTMEMCSSSDNASDSETATILQLLLDHGAEVGAPELKVLRQKPQFEELLLAKEPRGDPQACLERMVVHYERDEHRFEHVIDRCLELGADPNARVDGWPLLSRAIQRRSLVACEGLLKRGAHPEPECARTKSPLYHAVRRIGRNYHDLIVRYGATPRQNYRPRSNWASFESDKSDSEYWAAMRRMRANPPSTGPADPPLVVHQPTEEENAREQLRWIAVADALARPRRG